jgi:hypothetical protein
VASILGIDDPAGDALDGIRISDARTAVFLDDE